jgi:hypothetical protein
MPDITNKAEYAQYEADVAEFIAREGISFLSTGTVDMLHAHSEEDTGEPWFSWSPCECCGCMLGGNREYLYGSDANNELAEYVICEDSPAGVGKLPRKL